MGSKRKAVRDPAPPGKPEISRAAGLRAGELLEATGITHQILYRYVTLGLVEESKTTSTGQRLFHPRAVEAIRLIQRLNETGYTLRDIKDIFFKQRRLVQSASSRIKLAAARLHPEPDAAPGENPITS